MQYGHFDDRNREYVIDRVDTPAPWTNYIGVNDMCAVLSQTAGGYSFYKSPQYHRITRFRPNAPVERPGHYVYLRDDETGEYWSVSWQPVGKDLAKAEYECRHGLSLFEIPLRVSGDRGVPDGVHPRRRAGRDLGRGAEKQIRPPPQAQRLFVP